MIWLEVDRILLVIFAGVFSSPAELVEFLHRLPSPYFVVLEMD